MASKSDVFEATCSKEEGVTSLEIGKSLFDSFSSGDTEETECTEVPRKNCIEDEVKSLKNRLAELEAEEGDTEIMVDSMKEDVDLLTKKLAEMQEKFTQLKLRVDQQDCKAVSCGNERKISPDILREFDGKISFKNWEKQLELVRGLHKLNDDETRLLIISKLRGKALEWFDSKQQHMELPIIKLLTRMRVTFDRKVHKGAARESLSRRRWQSDETFEEYCMDKIILANKIPIDEPDALGYIIKGIPSLRLQAHARNRCFLTVSEMLEEFQGIPFSPEEESQVRKKSVSSNNKKSLDSENKKKRKGKRVCYYCKSTQHIVDYCPHRMF